MSKKLIYLLGIIITIIVGAVLCYIIHCDCHLNKNNNLDSQKSALINATSNPFSLSDAKSGLTINVSDNFNFLTSSSSFITPVSKDVSTGVAKIKEQLLKNPSQILTVSGFYKSNEKNTSKFNNLGLARANSIKEYLVSKGISANQVNTTSELKDSIVADNNNILFGPLALSFSRVKSIAVNNKKTDVSADSKLSLDISNSIQDVVVKDNSIKNTSKTYVLNFQIGESYTSLKHHQRKKMIEIAKTVKGKDLKVYIVGHTDNFGKASSNKRLGKKRADCVKKELLKLGVSSKQVVTSSKGEEFPIATNLTEEGRNKNRRIVITIK